MAKAELGILLEGASLKTAQSKWAAVEAACSATNNDAANAPLIEYIGYLRGLYPTGVLIPKKGDATTRETNFLTHLNTTFEYVGYPAPGLTGGPTGPLQAGIVAVIPATGGIREYQKARLGAFNLPEQNSGGDLRGHLFVMTDFGSQCLSVDNLQELDQCVELRSFPDVSPKFSPGIRVGICGGESGFSGMALALGHETAPGTTEVAGNANYPADCHESINVAESNSLMKRGMNMLAATFGVRRAYATDKGLGGIGSTLSPFGVLETLIFGASFGPPNVVGTPPILDNGNFDFTQSVTAPGSILVQSSLGNLTGPLVVLSQGGGACSNCGQLLFRAHLYSVSGTPADDGVYEVNWTSVQAAPSVKGAPFVLRDNAGLEIARLTYVTSMSSNQLVYNGVVIGSWTRNVAQTFKIRVDLNNDKTTLFINGSEVTGAIGVPFADTAASNLATFSAEFGGIDSGVMGWDEIGIQRVSDQPAF